MVDEARKVEAVAAFLEQGTIGIAYLLKEALVKWRPAADALSAEPEPPPGSEFSHTARVLVRNGLVGGRLFAHLWNAGFSHEDLSAFAKEWALLDSEGSDPFQRRLKVSLSADGRYLDLSGFAVEQVPPAVFALPHLQELCLAYSGITSISSDLGRLLQLQTLDLRGTKLQSLPVEIGQLARLQTLHLSNTPLQSLPVEIGQLAQLQTLHLIGTPLRSLPVEIGQLTQLQTLDLSNIPDVHFFRPRLRARQSAGAPGHGRG